MLDIDQTPKRKKDEIILDDRYSYNINSQIGSGAFGVIFLGQDIEDHKPVAIKVEERTCPHPQLLTEAKLYQKLIPHQGIPNVYYSGVNGYYNVMVMEFLGKSLEDLFEENKNRFSLKTTCMLGIQMIQLIEHFHSKLYIHRDMKPDNFCMGQNENRKYVYLIDYGLAKRYKNPKTNLHIPYRDNRSLIGTARYVSVNTHLGIEQSRRDDLESIGYILIYFLKGCLPWQGLPAKNTKEKYKKIRDMKIKTKVETLCLGLPKQLQDYIHYTRNLPFDAKPNYQKLESYLRIIMADNHWDMDYQYDWEIRYKLDLEAIEKNFSNLKEKFDIINVKSNDKKDETDSKKVHPDDEASSKS